MLTNSEVVAILQSQKEKSPSDIKVLESLAGEEGLKKTNSVENTRKELLAKVKALKERYQLTKEEVLQLLNHRPKTVLEAFLCVEQAILDSRITEEDLESILEVLG